VSKEDPSLSFYASQWMKNLFSLPQCKERRIQALAIDLSGQSIFITRYVSPQKPPAQLSTTAAFRRFVSLIPFLEDSVSFVGSSNIWCTTQVQNLYELLV
jgi:coiled-coil and C2 domain-containing protein 2A